MNLSRNVKILLLIVLNIALDQVSKFIVRKEINPGEIIEVIGNKFIMTSVMNKGAFLGMGSELSESMRLILLLIVPVLVLGFVIYYIIRKKDLDRLSLVAFCCIIGGGIANIYDRIVHGKVLDFFHIDLGGIFKTGIFNVADMSVTTGMIMLLIASFRSNKKEKTKVETAD